MIHASQSTSNHVQIAPRNDIDLQYLFAQCFGKKYNTLLQGQALEPLYEPASGQNRHHVIYYRDDYFSSALHEIAHWCIAGPQRRQQVDYGYWYSPDGRSPEEQQAFELVEIKPQAIEWAFSLACDIPFRVSIDNLNAQSGVPHSALLKQEQHFKGAVYQQLLEFIVHGFPSRAALFLEALHVYYATAAISINDKRLVTGNSSL